MKKISMYMKILFSKRILAIILAGCLAAGSIPAVGVEGVGSLIVQAAEGFCIDNGYIKVTVSEKNGGFGIRTLEGDKMSKDDNNKQLLFEYDEDNTSFTSFQVTRNGVVKEYIFGGKYEGCSNVNVAKENETLTATWSVDDLTFVQTISLANSGANEHGTVYITYSVENAGEPAEVKCRMLMDTSLGYQDYAYYNVGDSANLLEREVTLGENGYNKTFYALDNPDYPSVMAYTINAAIDNVECEPYQTTFAHWNNLASTIFDYEIDDGMTFTNPFNKSYQTADSAYALYFDMGEVSTNASSVIGTYYGVFSNETVAEEATMAINMVAPEVLEFATDASGEENQSQFKNDGKFTIKTYISGTQSYSKLQVLVYTTGGITPIDQSGNVTNSTYDNPYFIQISDFSSTETIEYDWSFYAEPQAAGQYAKVHYKIYDVSDEATNNTGTIMRENLLGEGSTYILCPGSVEKIPTVKFTGTTPDTIYNAGVRMLYLTGDNFGMLADQSSYKVMLSRIDGMAFGGFTSKEIPSDHIELDTSANKMTVMLTDETVGTLPVGQYELKIDYVDQTKEDITAPALRFHVSNSIEYRNDAYGYLAVIKTEDNQYYIKNYVNKSNYDSDIAESGTIERDDVLLEFKGSFIKDRNSDEEKVIYKGLSISDTDNIMTMNDCLDIKNGTVTITEENGSVTVDFDADLYTTGAGTSIWSGVCALTELEAGVEYALIGYDGNGERTGDEYGKETIALLWPSVGQGFQELMGLLFEFKYAELGVISDEESKIDGQRLLAFGAALDLSFIIPDSINRTTTTTETDNGWSMVMQQSIDYGPDMIRSHNKQRKYNTDTVNTKATTTTEINSNSDFTETATSMGDDAEAGDGDTKSASVQIDDILFGGGYLGINMSIALGIPGYLEGMPGMEAILAVRTIGDWAFGVSGVCEFATFSMEGSIKILSKDGIPVPDELSFFIGGFVPGINVDGYGILWLQGGGGGISNLYDTIFLESGIPPLKLLLEVQVSLMQIISAKGSLGLSLMGIDASISNGRLINSIGVLDNASIGLQWYPQFHLEGAVNVAIMDAILGGGYIVVEHDGFFEFFIRAALQIPGAVPIVGGIQIADANLGANADKIWGQFEAIGMVFGVTYFWGEDIDWTSGSKVYPTYPELVGMDGGSSLAICPVGVSEETGKTLYMCVGTNLTRTNDVSDELYTDPSATKHGLNFGDNGCSKLLLIEWNAESESEAKTQADNFKIVQKENGSPYYLKPMDSSKPADLQADANANLTYDMESKKATLAISFTNPDDFDVDWIIETKVAATLVVYDVEPLPSLSKENITVSVNGTQAAVTLKGERLSEFTKLSFIATNNETGEETRIHGVDQETGFSENEVVSFEMPANLSSGTYSLSIVAKDNDATYYSEATKGFVFTNPNQPAAPTIASVEGAGDYKLAVSMNTGNTSDVFDGYEFSAYAYNAETQVYEPVTGVQNLLYYKDGNALSYNEDGTIAAPTGSVTGEPFLIGGHFESEYRNEETGELTTLIAGFSEGNYRLDVKCFKIVEDGKALLYSEVATQTVTVKKPVNTEVTVTTVLPSNAVNKNITLSLGDGTTYQQDYINANELSFTLSSSTEKIKGRWELDGGTREGTSGEITELTQRTSLYFTNLEDGTHTLEFVGQNEYGDKTAVKYRFTVDTQGPRLLLSEPLNGSLFDYKNGTVTISGITDKDALLTVIDNDTQQTLIENILMSTDGAEGTIQIEPDGSFSTTVSLDTHILNHNLTIRMSDVLGNVTEKEVLVVSDGLGSIEDLFIYAGDRNITNTKFQAGTQHNLKLFAKLKEQSIPVEINNSALVDWGYVSVAGETSLTQNEATAILHTSDDSEGMVTARFLINDAGAYTVIAAFGGIGETLIDLNSEFTRVEVSNQIYTGREIEPPVRVWYKDALLTEGSDYVVAYRNNINVSTGSEEKPQVIVTGINSYTGSVTATFEIEYLPVGDGETEPVNPDSSDSNTGAPHPNYTISGIQGENGYYVSDVTIIPSQGYELVSDLKEENATNITLKRDGNHVVSFRMRNTRNGALTSQINLEIKIDKTRPRGSLSLDERTWDKFISKITFGLYKVENQTVTIEAEDNYSGVDSIMYVISEKGYESVSELEADDVKWKTYSETKKPYINENKNQVIYARFMDKAGNMRYISSSGINVDTIAPEISALSIITDESLTESSLKFSFSTNESGTYYYAVMKASEKMPDAETIKAANLEDAICGNGNITSEMCNEMISVSVSGLEANTMYLVYVVMEDSVFGISDGNLEANISEVASSEPVFTKDITDATEDSEESTEPEEEVISTGIGDYVPVLLFGFLMLAVCAAFIVVRRFRR